MRCRSWSWSKIINTKKAGIMENKLIQAILILVFVAVAIAIYLIFYEPLKRTASSIFSFA